MVAVALAVLAAGGPVRAEEPPAVVLELFTSEGCSSCPPAEELFDQLVGEPGAPVALEFHVNYWNKLGWTDPYSKPEWSQRQGRYAAVGGSEEIYTPQALVDGAHPCVGGDGEKVRRGLDAARAKAHDARVRLKVGTPAGGKLPVELEYDMSQKMEKPTLVVALTEDALESDVSGGENAGRKLSHQRVVRALVTPSTEESVGTHATHVDLPAAGAAAHLGVAAFLQDARMRIHGAAFARPANGK